MTELTSAPAPTDRAAGLDTPIGRLRLVATSRGLRAIEWPDIPTSARAGDDRVDSVDAGSHEAPRSVGDDLLDEVVRQLVEYFAGERLDFDVPLDPVGTDFQRDAWTALRRIPYGDTVSYGEQAERSGDRSKARAVGAANGQNPIPVIVPCHRVIGSDGSLTGFAGGIDAKRWLLDHEARVVGRTLV